MEIGAAAGRVDEDAGAQEAATCASADKPSLKIDGEIEDFPLAESCDLHVQL